MANDPNTIQYVIQEDGFWYIASKEKNPYVPYITVSAKGIANGLSTEYNDGCDFGPDSYNPSVTSGVPLTQTSGIWESNAYAYGLATNKNMVIEIKASINSHFVLDVSPSFPSVSGISGSYGPGSGFIPIYPNVAFDFNGSVIDINYAFTSRVIQLEEGSSGVYIGHIKNVTINVNTAISQELINIGSGNLQTSLENIQINGNGNVPIGVVCGSNTSTRNVSMTHVLVGYKPNQGITGLYVYNPTFYGTQGLSGCYFMDLSDISDTVAIIGGRSIDMQYLVYINANRNISHLSIIGHNCDAASTPIQITANSYTIDGLTIISQFEDPSGYYLYADAGTGIIKHITFSGSELHGAPSANGYFAVTGTVEDLTFDNSVSNMFNSLQITGTTAGSLKCKPANIQSGYKKVIIYLDGYENDSTTAQTYTYPVPFSTVAEITSNTASVPVVSTSLTEFSIAPDTTTAYTGIIVIEGY